MYTFDSREVTHGDTFLCLPGGEKYTKDAQKKGAIDSISLTRIELALFAKTYFSAPDKSLCVIGVTGTNGKTSISHFVYQALQYCKHTPLVLGTLTSPLTTMESWNLYKHMNDHAWNNGSHVIMVVAWRQSSLL